MRNVAAPGQERQLRADTHTLLDSAVDAVFAHVCVLDTSGVILAVNKAWRKFHESNVAPNTHGTQDTYATHFVGSNYIGICAAASGANADEANAMAEGIRLVASGELPEFSLEYPCHSPSKQRWFMARVTRFEDDSGRLVVTHENITARILLEQHHRAAHDVLHKLSNNVPGVIYQYQQFGDGRTCFPYVSEGLREIFELAPEDLMADAGAVFRRIHADDLERVRTSIEQSERTLQPWLQEYRVLLPEVGLRWHAGNARPERQTDGSTIWYGHASDITSRVQRDQELKASETRFRHFFENNNSVMLLVDPKDGRLVDANQAACHFYGHRRSALLAKRIGDINTLKPQEVAREMQRAVQERCNYFSFRHRLASGEVRDVEVYSTPTVVDGRNILFSMVHDVTARKQAEASLKLAANVFVHAREGIMITDAQGLILDVNETFSRITGYSRDEVLGQNPRMLNSGRQSAEVYASMWQNLREKGHWYGEMWNRRKGGELYAVLETISRVSDESGAVQNYVALLSDITAMKEHEHELEHVAHYDALTQLPNRVLLFDRLQQAIIRSQREKTHLAVAFMDLDGFKAVNDSHGHNVGDTLLIEVARNVKACMREGDTLARIGGDEFVAVLVDLTQMAEYEAVVARMLHAAALPVRIGSLELHVSASIGVTLYPQDGVDADMLLRHADQAMYLAKQGGKNRCHLFDVSFDTQARARRHTMEQLQHALERDEFRLFYQPKVDLGSGAVVGWEALLRWQHASRGLLVPADFLFLINDHPMSIEVGKWVTARALGDMQQMRDMGIPHAVSINIGARELQDESLVRRLSAFLARHPDIDPGQLQLEVLESTALEDVIKVGSVMRECKQIGVSFALDDFGTGYSSLTYLKHLPAETLKIDKSFVKTMTSDSNDRAIVEGVIGLASAFDKEVIAEGVESFAHAALLKQLGCRYVQGYGIAQPMPLGRMQDWLQDWEREQRHILCSLG
jgi:diguanylate cyclase (GGDEF)-like protein/PAS domain S-box-containing protein